jgi:hypothetical protein
MNAHVFCALQLFLQKMSGRDNYCCFMFDDHILVREYLHFNQKFDCIEFFLVLWKSEQKRQHYNSCSTLNDLWPTQKVEATSGFLLYVWKH